MRIKLFIVLIAGMAFGFSGAYLVFTWEREVQKPDYRKNPLPENNNSTNLQLFNVDTTTVRHMEMGREIIGFGNLVHPETDLKDITFKISGYVEEIFADFTGKYIKKGEPLLSVYSPQLVSAQEEFLRAYNYYRKMKNSEDLVLKKSARELYEAAYKRLKYWDITDEQIEKLKETGRPEKTITLYSPYDGWVMEKYVNLGSKVEAGQPVLRLAKHRNLWLLVDIYEKDIPFVKEGLKVKVSFISYPAEELEGRIDYIYPMMDTVKRTLKLRIVIDNSQKRYFPGMFGNVRIAVPLGRMKVLPETAVLDTGKRQYVFVQKNKGVFEPVPVKTGIYSNGFYQLVEGPPVGTVVANSALFMLDADAQLKGKYKEKKGTGGETMHHHHH